MFTPKKTQMEIYKKKNGNFKKLKGNPKNKLIRNCYWCQWCGFSSFAIVNIGKGPNRKRKRRNVAWHGRR